MVDVVAVYIPFERIRRIETVGLLGGNLSFQTSSRADPDLKNCGTDV
jgi:hypothetical protein